MEYERALYRVYERVIDDLNATPSAFLPSNASTPDHPQDRHYFVPFCCPFLEIQGLNFVQRLLSTITANERRGYLPLFVNGAGTTAERSLLHSSSSATNGSAVQNNAHSSNPEGGNVTSNITSAASISHRFSQRAISRLQSITGGQRRRARQRRRTVEQQQLTDSAATHNNTQSEAGTIDDLEAMENNESSPLRPPGTSNVASGIDPSDATANEDNRSGNATTERSTSTISFGGNVNTNPFAARTPSDRDDEEANDVPACSQKFVYHLMNFAMYTGLAHLLILWILHSTYVRPDVYGGFLGVWHPSFASQESAYFYRFKPPTRHLSASIPGVDETLSERKEAASSSVVTNHTENKTSIEFYNGPTCIEYALSTRPVRFFYNTTNSSEVDSGVSGSRNITESHASSNSTILNGTLASQQSAPQQVEQGNWTALPLLEKDEVLQISILYGSKCPSTAQCSKTHVVTHSTPYDEDSKWNETADNSFLSSRDWTNAKYWEKPMYKFSTMEALLHVDDEFLWAHNVSIVNITVTERCLSSGSDGIAAGAKTKAAEILSQIYGIDAAIINQLMYGIREVDGSYRDGFLQNMETQERWSWKKEFLEFADPRNTESRASGWLGTKLGVIFVSLLGFFLITSVTALIVRVLTSSGVVLMFPLFAWFRIMGMPGADDRILGLSYPWIGRARNAARLRAIHPDSHLIWAHIAKIALFYIMYEASQAAWSVVIYGKSIPEGLPVWIYGFAMIWEYYNMVFVRSAMSAYFFPRITLLYFLGYHFYFYSVPYGYFDCALLPLFLFMVHAMLYSLLAFEIPAARRGAMSLECPREVYNRVSWPEWTASLPHEWTLFLPLNSRYIPLHDRDLTAVNAAAQTARPDVTTTAAQAPIPDSVSSAEDLGEVSGDDNSDDSVANPDALDHATGSPSLRSGLVSRRTAGANTRE